MNKFSTETEVSENLAVITDDPSISASDSRHVVTRVGWQTHVTENSRQLIVHLQTWNATAHVHATTLHGFVVGSRLHQERSYDKWDPMRAVAALPSQYMPKVISHSSGQWSST